MRQPSPILRINKNRCRAWVRWIVWVAEHRIDVTGAAVPYDPRARAGCGRTTSVMRTGARAAPGWKGWRTATRITLAAFACLRAAPNSRRNPATVPRPVVRHGRRWAYWGVETGGAIRELSGDGIPAELSPRRTRVARAVILYPRGSSDCCQTSIIAVGEGARQLVRAGSGGPSRKAVTAIDEAGCGSRQGERHAQYKSFGPQVCARGCGTEH